MTDQESDLLERVRGGDHAAYSVLVRRYTPVALRTALALGAADEAEDVVQESFVRAYRALGSFRPGSEFRPWLLTIVANQTRSAHRSRSRRADRESRALPDLPAADPAESALARDRLRRLRELLAGLPDRQREVLVCRYLLELGEKETCAVLGLAPGTAKSRAARALRRLRAELAELEPDEEVRDG